MKRSPLKRRTPLRKRRSKPRRGAPTAREKAEARRFAYDRARGLCELRLPDCKGGVLPFDGDVLVRAHLVHLVSRGAGGSWHPRNLALGCHWCHIVQWHGKGIRPAWLGEDGMRPE